MTAWSSSSTEIDLNHMSGCTAPTELFHKNAYDLNAYNNVRNILYNTDVITNFVKVIVQSPVRKLV